MASGFGFSGGRPRCFAFWQEFQKCYAGTDDPKNCANQCFDYFECLHHYGERERAKKIEGEYLRKAESVAKEGRKTADVLSDGAIVGLGLIQQKEQEEKKKS
ncbi:hypothetical protein AGABI1DRAFT_115320 [Agaricus bisporus var. burnettii JB137-S8]|uniref:NADH dehydrogenase [ubiquinone] iron-sulfur protein 5 n=2 Tax=Agaricus bisporus var. burnettii TaxID=192524 RepID=K5X3A5_AGABU|nr:hypothetical protein AGABI2DRAFT_194282 [Agaricus bisporus var. bisporus H97]XP_007332054.1 uncharacterized protein AGABI1DRAFT_115320 [Agaricus bisporus var. burnettii JB137-S8]EKM77417.1 hypothetical protein AGABI1DRAFT_115320 [Agaricus bisporus var. burnettii JB137-S8]EKV45322.1 hypothetical protein AGABI2DRAFT_194282 [Agaricus bisporus var. bisporus H97]KAF7763624.1 hypothetical protein Agabi119p4_8161 [Agaricus bisporus var. burnettii]